AHRHRSRATSRAASGIPQRGIPVPLSLREGTGRGSGRDGSRGAGVVRVGRTGRTPMIRRGVRRLAASIFRLARSGRPAPAEVSHAFLIGGMKCGTWTMFKLLRAHPQIAVSKPKELKFFSRMPAAEWHRYHEHFDITKRTRVLLEGTTQSSKRPDTAENGYTTARDTPDAKLC